MLMVATGREDHADVLKEGLVLYLEGCEEEDNLNKKMDEHTKDLNSKGQGGITCGAIDEPRKSSKAIDERVIINFRDKNVVIARFRDKNVYR